MTYPDAPINLVEDLAQRSATTLGLTWEDGAANGGGEIFAYTINQSIEGGAYTVLYSVTQKSVVISGLTFGTSYKFKVQAENAFDLSSDSSELELIAATTPVAPEMPSMHVDTDQVIVTWSEPSARGTPITGYRIYIRQSDLTYQ